MKSMHIAINKMHFPVTTLGYGRRIGIWVQGCSIRCPGCISRDTWEFDPDRMIEIRSLAREMKPWLEVADGVTISGGEPFDQSEGLQSVVQRLRHIVKGDIIVYSGYSYSRLIERYSEILLFIDVIISGPFILNTGHSLALRGSDNQRIHLLTDLAKSRYPQDLDRRSWEGNRRFDAVVADDTLWLAGIPAPGAMESLMNELSRRGMECSMSDQHEPMVRA